MPEKTKQELRDLLAKELREEVKEGVLFLLFLVTSIPETKLATPNEMMEWVGVAALNSKDGAEYVLGCLRNRQQSSQKRRVRESNYARDLEERSSVLSRLEALTEWKTLSRKERQWVLDAAQAKSRAALAQKWGLTLGGTKDRLDRLRKKIEKIKKQPAT